MFRFLILGLLRGGARLHGYALVKEYRERSGAEVSTGNFYRELQRLVLDGLIRGTDNPPDADARRTPYAITAQGARVFDEWLATTEVGGGNSSEDELSARALFIEDIDTEAALSLLDRLQEHIWFAGKALERARQQVLGAAGEASTQAPRFRPLPLLLNRRLKRVAADIEFLEEVRAAYTAHLQAQRGSSPDPRPLPNTAAVPGPAVPGSRRRAAAAAVDASAQRPGR